ncbi:MAG: hypothetical protein RBR97_17120, partial [Bacteroidales bacterium]|nr:hypothetical protein [Bacteroidales bacterium]
MYWAYDTDFIIFYALSKTADKLNFNNNFSVTNIDKIFQKAVLRMFGIEITFQSSYKLSLIYRC